MLPARTAPRPARSTALLTVLLTALLTGLLLSLLTALPSAAGAATATPAGTASARGASYAIPSVGSCWDYSYKAATRAADRSDPVSCAGTHTAQTVKVVTVRSLTRAGALTKAYAGCSRALRRAVGSELARTAYDYRYFTPSRKERRKGARWVRCDVVLANGRSLAPLPTPLVSTPLTDAIGLCAVTARGTTLRTTCAAEHDYRLSATYRAAGKRYPGRDRLLRSVILTCAKKVSTPKKFWAFYPDADDWRAGARDVSCLSRSRA